MSNWLGLALLSGAWIFATGYFQHAEPNVAAWVAGIGALLLCFKPPVELPSRLAALAGTLLVIPAIILIPWPYRTIPILFAAGFVISFAKDFGFIFARTAGGLLLSGGILLIQNVALYAYMHFTAMSHELPLSLAKMLGGVAWVLGAPSAQEGNNIHLHSMREVHSLGATWELLVDPASFVFIAGAFVIAVFRIKPDEVFFDKLRPFIRISFVAAVWLPLRAALMMGLLLHRAMRTDHDAPLMVMEPFFSPWFSLVLLIPFALACGKAVGPFRGPLADENLPRPLRAILSNALAFAGVALAVAAIFWVPAGERKPGRVAVDELHSEWERSDYVFDSNWYGHMSAYNYYCVYDYCSHFYDMARIDDPSIVRSKGPPPTATRAPAKTTRITSKITPESLEALDVLILKMPTQRYEDSEIAAIERFVGNGGGLMLVAEHTDYVNTSTHLNQLARKFGFEFRPDCVFGVDNFFEEKLEPALIPHPITQQMPTFDFAISCSIEPRGFDGRAAIVNTGLKNLLADYHAPNYYPQARDHAVMRYGSFVQLWTTTYGAGRVLGFTDSTVFSNFSTFEPGKPELMLGMIEWLNQKNSGRDYRVPLLSLALAALLLALVFGQPVSGSWALLCASGLCAWTAAAFAINANHRAALPLPAAKTPYKLVTIDRTVCDGPLASGTFIKGVDDGFGIFERWILRLGYYNARESDSKVFRGDAAVFFYPRPQGEDRNRYPGAEFLKQMNDYVENGGKVVIIDSPDNTLPDYEGKTKEEWEAAARDNAPKGQPPAQPKRKLASTASALLVQFGMSIKHDPKLSGTLSGPSSWQPVPVTSAGEVTGGEAFATIDGKTVGAKKKIGKGFVYVIGFGSRFCDMQMGVTGDVEPNEDLQKVFGVEYDFMRSVIEEK